MSDIETLDHIGRQAVRLFDVESGLAWLPQIYSVDDLLFFLKNGFPVFYKNDEMDKIIQHCWDDFENGYLGHCGDWVKMRENNN